MLRTLIVCVMQTSVTTDTSGAVTSRTRYKAFGEVLLTSNQETTGTLNTEHKFGGQTFDTGTDLYFYGGRYYDRTLRRFTSPEGYLPAFNAPQTLNRYSFGGNNPLSPTGGVASFSGVAVTKYKPSNHNGLPVSSSNAGGTKTVSQESAGSANQGFAWQMAMLAAYNAGYFNSPPPEPSPTGSATGLTTQTAYRNVENISANLSQQTTKMYQRSSATSLRDLVPSTIVMIINKYGNTNIQINNPGASGEPNDEIRISIYFPGNITQEARIRVGTPPNFTPERPNVAWTFSKGFIVAPDPGGMTIGLLAHEVGHIFNRIRIGEGEYDRRILWAWLTGWLPGKSFIEEDEEFADEFWNDETKGLFWVQEPSKS